jgi:drug/metabolite transporter (DMT)-like permease
MQHIPPLVFSALALFDPALTAILSWVGGIERLPSLYAWGGGAVVMSGVGLISYGEHQRSQQEKAEQTAGHGSAESGRSSNRSSLEEDVEMIALEMSEDSR